VHPHSSVPALAIGEREETLGTSNAPTNQLPVGTQFRRLVRSLSLRPSWLLASWADQTEPRLSLPKAFTSGLPALKSPRELPDMTTAPNGELRRQDFHLQVQQLVSLRSLHKVCRSGTPFPPPGRVGPLPLLHRYYEILRRLPVRPTPLAHACGAVPALDASLRSAGRCIRNRPLAWSVVAGGPTRNVTQERGRPPRFLGNPCTRVPRSSTPMGVVRPCPERSDHCGLPKNLRRRPPPYPPLRGSITRPTCALSTLHDEGHPIAVHDSLPACWLGVNWAGLAPAGFHPRISR
jgi:hypothetical protein